MPNPEDYDSKDSWMDACMHEVKTVEGKPQDQAVAQCLSMWRNKDKSAGLTTCAAKKIVASLDKIADSVQRKGFTREAQQIDVLSNSLERLISKVESA
jgi:hypothetical protein